VACGGPCAPGSSGARGGARQLRPSMRTTSGEARHDVTTSREGGVARLRRGSSQAQPAAAPARLDRAAPCGAPLVGPTHLGRGWWK
jgi:hypothetical protein